MRATHALLFMTETHARLGPDAKVMHDSRGFVLTGPAPAYARVRASEGALDSDGIDWYEVISRLVKVPRGTEVALRPEP